MTLDIEARTNIHHEEPFKVELSRGQKGSYGWTITVHTVTGDQAVTQLKELDAKLQTEFNHNGDA